MPDSMSGRTSARTVPVRVRVLTGVVTMIAGLAVVLTACGGSSDQASATPSATSDNAASTLAPPSSRIPAPSSALNAPPPTTPVNLPTPGTAETVAPPAANAEADYLKMLRSKGVELDAETAASLGNSVCRIRKTGGETAAAQYAAAVMKASLGREPSPAHVSAVVDSSNGMC